MDVADIRSTGGNTIEVDWFDDVTGRVTASGVYNGPSNGATYGSGSVTFPDDKLYTLRFYPR